MLVGSNLAWCHPVLYQRIAAAKEARRDMKLVLIDPRRTVTAELADLHLPIKADGDVALFTGLLAYLASQGRIDAPMSRRHTTGSTRRSAAASTLTLERGGRGDRARHRADRVRSTGCSPRPNGRDRVQPGRQPIRVGHRQGRTPSSTAISRRAASASRAWGHSR